MNLDELDSALIDMLSSEPRISVLEISRRLRVARGTVQARLDRMQRGGVITDFGPSIDPMALGYTVIAFINASIRQGQRDSGLLGHLRDIPEVIEVYTVTGDVDLLIRVVARSNDDLQRVIDLVVTAPGIERTSTVIVLASQIERRMIPLVHASLRSRSRDHEGGSQG